MNEQIMKRLSELSAQFNLKTCEDWETFFDSLENIKQTGCAYPSVMKTGSFKANNKFYEYADTDSITHNEHSLTVRTIRTFTDDDQLVLITDKNSYDKNEALYFGEMQNAPEHLMSKRVSKFYSDYVPTHGSFLGVRVIE